MIIDSIIYQGFINGGVGVGGVSLMFFILFLYLYKSKSGCFSVGGGILGIIQ